jgi:hypothetical protein
MIKRVTVVPTPEWKAAMADAATFMDMNRGVAGWAEEHQIV